MPYCTNCGSEVEHAPEVAAVAESVSAEVRIAEINAERDIKVEQIRARQAREQLETTEAVAEVEAEASVEVAEAEAEVIGAIIAEGADDEPEADPAGAPIVVEPSEPEPDAPPPPEAEEHHEPPARKSGMFGF